MAFTLGEPCLTRWHYLAASICSAPHLWQRFFQVVEKNGLEGEMKVSIQGAQVAFSQSKSVREAATTMVNVGGSVRDAGVLILHSLSLNYKDKDVLL